MLSFDIIGIFKIIWQKSFSKR